MRTRLITVVSLLALSAFNATSANANLATRITEQSAVTVEATPRTLSGAIWEFELRFTTHSGALADDPAKASTLVTNTGKAYAPIKWEGDGPGGHHRKGVLQFKPVAPRPTSLELRMTRQGEAQPRSFKWLLQDQ